MNKILQSASTGEINVTNDGATILKAIQLDNAAAKILVNISKVQDDEVGDGTTSVAVLAAELLREAEKLIAQKIHPQTIIEGYRIASSAALKALEKSTIDHSCVFSCLFFWIWRSRVAENVASRNDPQGFRQDLFNIARTTLSSKVLAQDKEYFANLAVDAVLRLKVRRLSPSFFYECTWCLRAKTGFDRPWTYPNHQKSRRQADRFLPWRGYVIALIFPLLQPSFALGFILDKTIAVNSPKRMENCKMLIANTCVYLIPPAFDVLADHFLKPWIRTRSKCLVLVSK